MRGIFSGLLSAALLGAVLGWGGCGSRDGRTAEESSDLHALQEAASHCAFCRAYCRAASFRAESEGALDAARLFAALAYSQQVHELLYVSAIHHFGGRYDPPRHPQPDLSATSENLRSLYALRTDLLSAPITLLLERGNRYAARLMIRHVAFENRTRRLIDHLLLLPEGERSCHYLVCPQCGYLISDLHPDPYCPQCMTPQIRFHRF